MKNHVQSLSLAVRNLYVYHIASDKKCQGRKTKNLLTNNSTTCYHKINKKEGNKPVLFGNYFERGDSMHRIQMKEVFRKPFFILFAVGSLLSLIVSQVCIFLATEDRVSTYASMYAIFLLVKYWVYICIALTIFAYLCLADSHTRDVDETIAAYKGGKYYQRFCVKYFIAGAVVLQLLMLALYWFAFRTMEHFADLFPALFTMYICNIFLPLLVCLLAASFFACWNNQIRGVTGLIIFLVLVSPLSEILVNGDKPNSIVERIIYAVRHVFGFFYESSFWEHNTQIGLQTEWTRFASQFFWIFLFLGLLFWNTHKKKRVISVISLAVSVLLLVYTSLPASTYHFNSRLLSDEYTYGRKATSTSETAVSQAEKLKNIGYTITDYQLQVTCNRQLQVSGTMQLQAQKQMDAFVLTLYRGYTVKNLQCADGTPLDWSVDGDYITIHTAQPVTQLAISMEYAGYHDIYYSNRNGAMLPGWLPWYPMAGEHTIWLPNSPETATMTYGYNTYNRIEQANIQLQVDAPFTYVTNLEQIDENTYRGASDSITLIGGYIEKIDESPLTNIVLFDNAYPTDNAYISHYKQICQRVYTAFDVYEIDKSLIDNKKIITTSYDIGRTTQNNHIAIFSDYILYGNSPDCMFQDLTASILLKKSGTCNLATSLGAGFGFDESPQDTWDYWYAIYGDTSDIEQINYSKTDLQIISLILAAHEVDRGPELVKDLAKYAFSDHDESNDDAFIKEMNQKYGAN